MRAIARTWSKLRLDWEVGLHRLPFFTQKVAVVLLGVLVATLALVGGVVVLLGPPDAGGPDRLVPEDPGRPPSTTRPADGPVAGGGPAGGGPAAPAPAPADAPAAAAGPAGRAAAAPDGPRTAPARPAGGAAPTPAPGSPPAASPPTAPPATASPPTAAPTTTTGRGVLPPVEDVVGSVVSTLLP